MTAASAHETIESSLAFEELDLNQVKFRSLEGALRGLDFNELEKTRKSLGSGIAIWNFNEGGFNEHFIWIVEGDQESFEDAHALEKEIYRPLFEFAEQCTSSSPQFGDLVFFATNPQTVVLLVFDETTVKAGLFVDGPEKIRKFNRGNLELSPTNASALISFGSFLSFLSTYTDISQDIGIRFRKNKELVVDGEEASILTFLNKRFETGQAYLGLLDAFDYDYRKLGLPSEEAP
tara:strand:- start:2788 stop:3489 length:702 start_codon:yes stop_codon:yes gene_type:complete